MCFPALATASWYSVVPCFMILKLRHKLCPDLKFKLQLSKAFAVRRGTHHQSDDPSIRLAGHSGLGGLAYAGGCLAYGGSCSWFEWCSVCVYADISSCPYTHTPRNPKPKPEGPSQKAHSQGRHPARHINPGGWQGRRIGCGRLSHGSAATGSPESLSADGASLCALPFWPLCGNNSNAPAFPVWQMPSCPRTCSG